MRATGLIDAVHVYHFNIRLHRLISGKIGQGGSGSIVCQLVRPGEGIRLGRMSGPTRDKEPMGAARGRRGSDRLRP